MADEYDVVVIGAGAAGENVADYAQKHGLTAVVVERELVGGQCSYWACMPSKALLRPGDVLAATRRVSAAAPAVTGRLDVAAAMTSRNAFAGHWDDKGQAAWLESAGIALVRGNGRLTGERRVEVSHEDGPTTTLTARHAVVVATGSSALMPAIDGLAEADPWDNREATSTDTVPARLLVVGGGAVGVELAQAWKRLGSAEVTLVESEDRLLPREEPFAGVELATALGADGIRVLTGARLSSVSRDHGLIRARLDEDTEIEADEILVATGRRANTWDVGLESVGLTPGEFLEVDDHLRVKKVQDDWLYAVGDVNGRALFTHQGKYQARIAGAAIAGENTSAVADTRAVPRVVFTDPQVAAVGLTERQARANGVPVRAFRYDLGRVAGGALHGQGVSGTCQLVVDDRDDVPVGATFVGPDAGELLHAATVAVVAEVPLGVLWHAVPAFPTRSEVWLRLLETDRDARRS